METIKMIPFKPTIICEMHEDIKMFPLKPTIICEMHGDDQNVSTQTNYNL